MTATNKSFSGRYFSTLLNGLEQAQSTLPALTQAGEAVATRLVQGGRLFAASVRPDFTSEAFIRSGGLMLLEEYTPDTQLSVQDTVLIGWSNTDPAEELALTQRLLYSGAYLVGLGPLPPKETSAAFLAALDYFLESNPPCPTDITTPFGHAKYPLVSLQTLVLLWAFTGELVAALTRQDTMPTMFQSVLVPNARPRNEQRQDLRFEADHSVPPIPPGQLSGAYLDHLATCYQALIASETTAIEHVARAGLATLEAGHQIHAFLISHFPVLQHGAPGDPGYMQRLTQVHGETPSNEELATTLNPGDLFFFLGYYRRPTAAYTIAQKTNVRIAEIITGTHSADAPDPDLIIHPHWPFGDALVAVPGYDIEILPSSGIIQTAIYWAVLGTMAYIDQDENSNRARRNER